MKKILIGLAITAYVSAAVLLAPELTNILNQVLGRLS